MRNCLKAPVLTSFCRLAAVAAMVKNASNKNTGALYFTSIYCKRHGLSRDGANYLAKSGV